MNIYLKFGLPFVNVSINYKGIGNITLENFEVEIGEMDYGMKIDGILGFDFIRSAKLVIDSKALQIRSGH